MLGVLHGIVELVLKGREEGTNEGRRHTVNRLQNGFETPDAEMKSILIGSRQ